ncbi:MAG: aldo/keto reductase [Anaerolineae bacterium]|nr:aldo/keto reductase [Anaerolineae bacterium]
MNQPLPKLAFGTGSFRGLYREVPDDEAVEAIHTALELGITRIDTAPWYGAFEAERIVGLALRDRPRGDYEISTKVCLWNENGEGVYRYDRDSVMWSFEGSLKRLGITHVDVLHIHDPLETAYAQVIAETYPTILELKHERRVGKIGVGTGRLSSAQALAEALPLDVVMLAGRYTLLDQTALPFLNALAGRGIPAWSAGIYSTGILATGSVRDAKFNYGSAPPEILARVRQLEAICARYHIPLRAAAAQFVRFHPAIDTLVLGIESAAQLRETLETFSVSIPRDFWQELKHEQLIDSAAPTPES